MVRGGGGDDRHGADGLSSSLAVKITRKMDNVVTILFQNRSSAFFTGRLDLSKINYNCNDQLGCCAPGTVLAQPATNIREGAQAPSLHAQHSHLRWHHQPCAREPRLVQHTADVTMGARPSHRWWQGGALSSESAMRSQNGQTF